MKAYYYLFYKLYKFSESAPSKWMSEWKASLAVDVLVYLVLLSIGGYYSIVTKKEMLPVANPKLAIFLIVITVVFINYFIFNYNGKWKKYAIQFDKLEKQKNQIGGIIVWAIILIIFINLIFMYYLLSQINWKKYNL